MSPLVIFEFADGTTKQYRANGLFRGLCNADGERPIRAYTNYLNTTILLALHPNGEAHPLYKNCGQYLVKEGTLVELGKRVFTDELYIPLGNGQHMEYNAYYDGPTLDREEAVKLFPEYFV